MNSQKMTAHCKLTAESLRPYCTEQGFIRFQSEEAKRGFLALLEQMKRTKAMFDKGKERNSGRQKQKTDQRGGIEKSNRRQEQIAQKEKSEICHTDSSKTRCETKNAAGIFSLFKRAFGFLPLKKQESMPQSDLEYASLLSAQVEKKDESGQIKWKHQ